MSGSDIFLGKRFKTGQDKPCLFASFNKSDYLRLVTASASLRSNRWPGIV